jgi:flagellar protein FlbD
MIKLTRLDGEAFVLNAELIRYVEQRPDTFITLTTGERFVVSETMDEVVDKAVRYHQHKHFVPPLPTQPHSLGAQDPSSLALRNPLPTSGTRPSAHTDNG